MPSAANVAFALCRGCCVRLAQLWPSGIDGALLDRRVRGRLIGGRRCGSDRSATAKERRQPEGAGRRQQDQLRELVAPRELVDGHGGHEHHESSAGEEQAGATQARSPRPADPERPEEARDQRQPEQRPRRVGDPLVPAQERRECVVHLGTLAVVRQHLERRSVHRVVQLEHPPRHGHLAVLGRPRRGEAAQEVRHDRAGVRDRLVQDHALGEVARDLRPRAPRLAGDAHVRRHVHVVDRRERRPRVLLDREPLADRLGRAEHPLVGGHREVRAVGERRHPRVQEVPVEPVQRIDPIVSVKPGRVGHQGQRERDDHHGDVGDADAQEEQREHRGHQHELGHRARERGGGERRPGERGRDRPDARPPQEQHARGQEQHLEERLGEDLLLEVELHGVEQDRRRGERGEPAPNPEPDEQRVDHDRDTEPEQVLHERDDLEPEAQRQDPQEGRIAERPQRSRAEVRPVGEVADRVREDQRRPVGPERARTQDGAEHEQGRELPVGARASHEPRARIGNAVARTAERGSAAPRHRARHPSAVCRSVSAVGRPRNTRTASSATTVTRRMVIAAVVASAFENVPASSAT